LGAAGFLSPTFAQQAATVAATPAPAADATPALESVVVTARKHSEVETEVPISMQAFSSKDLEDAGIVDLRTLKGFSDFQITPLPGVSTLAAGRAFSNLTFRGLGGANSVDPRQNSGGLFIDDIYVSGGQSSVMTSGVERVEVLNGPQNVEFGRNTFGGSINYITKNPPTTFSGEASASMGSHGSNTLDAMIGGPLGSDLLTGSLELNHYFKGASYTASDGGPLGQEQTQSVEGTLYAKPIPGLWVRLRGHYQQDDDSAAAVTFLDASQHGGTQCKGPGQLANGTPATWATDTFGGAPLAYFCGTVPTLGQLGGGVVNSNTAIPAAAYAGFVQGFFDPGTYDTAQHLVRNSPTLSQTPELDHSGMRRDVKRYSLQTGYDLPYNANFKFNIGYNDAAARTIWDLDRTVVNNYLEEALILNSDLTADARIITDPSKSVRGLLGMSYFTSHFQLAQIDYQPFGGNNSPTVAGPFPNDTGVFTNDYSYVPALYGSVEYDITSQVTASFEGRYQKDRSSTLTQPSSVQPAFEYTAQNNTFLPRAILQFKPAASTNIWASVSKGVQPTAFNSSAVNLPAISRAYVATQGASASIYTEQPTIEDFELGIKQKLLANRLEYSLTAYRMNWHHEVSFNSVANPAGCPLLSYATPACPIAEGITTAAFPNDAYIRGVEFSVQGILTHDWVAGANFDYKLPFWKSFIDAGQSFWIKNAANPFGPTVARFNGNQIAQQSRLNAAVNSTYTTPLTVDWNGFVRGDVLYTGSWFDSNQNIAKFGGYTRVNARLGASQKNTSLELYCTNLLDDKHWDYGLSIVSLAQQPFPTYATQGVTVGAPDRREVGVRLHYTF
jgi:iron complex outermembrane receptor protein